MRRFPVVLKANTSFMDNTASMCSSQSRAKGCPLDLHPDVFRPGDCARTRLAKANVLLHALDDAPTFHFTATRSFAEYLWRWLDDAGQEFGIVVAEG